MKINKGAAALGLTGLGGTATFGSLYLTSQAPVANEKEITILNNQLKEKDTIIAQKEAENTEQRETIQGLSDNDKQKSKQLEEEKAKTAKLTQDLANEKTKIRIEEMVGC